MAFGSGGRRSIQLSYGRNVVDCVVTTPGRDIIVAMFSHAMIVIVTGDEMARPEGLEPPTYGFEARRSIQLSYGRTQTHIRLRTRGNLIITFVVEDRFEPCRLRCSRSSGPQGLRPGQALRRSIGS